MALKYKIKREPVIDDDGSEIATVRGLSLNDIVGLVLINKDAMEGLFQQFNGRAPDSITDADINGVGISMIENAPTLVAQIIADGAARGEFAVADPQAMARAVFDATTRFHKPVHAAEWADPQIDAAFEGVWALVLAGLTRTAASNSAGAAATK